MTAANLTIEAYVRSLIRQDAQLDPRPFLVSAIGGGGKTTTLVELFDAAIRPRSILTSTTALGLPGAGREVAPPLSHKQKKNPALARVTAAPPAGSGLWLGPACEDIAGKHRGLDRDQLDAWVREQREAGDKDTLILCEADGSKRKPLKAHAEHEPVIPKTTDLTLILFGLSAIGQALAEPVVHRAPLFSAATGLEAGKPIQISNLLSLLNSGHFFKGIPPTSKIAVVFNQADCLDKEQRTQGFFHELAGRVLENSRISAVFFKGLDRGEHKTYWGQSKNSGQPAPFSAVIMAAGMSERMGGLNKLLLPLGGQTVIARTLSRVLSAGIPDLVVVTGFESQRVRETIETAIRPLKGGTNLTFVTNDRYCEGQGRSVAVGTQHLAPESTACFYVPGDQPFLSPLLLRHLMEEFETGKIMIPVREGRRSSPVLFDRSFYRELSSLAGDLGGRQVIQDHEDAVIEVISHDHSAGFDLDTPEDYERARSLVKIEHTERSFP
ncbi:MAG: putative selenium-dependent hydroxylase accessory protein YqeC [Fastidiosipila sp.]|jgi:molybdenum cofactor cytidylyltransferase|nr:putative selenium-dependent hydroxylase accessory protein YqeC [Fastidiosipila sp.]HPX93086.1 selenium cofactor biosynthesis protein YqeC [Bacillota bacterium]